MTGDIEKKRKKRKEKKRKEKAAMQDGTARLRAEDGKNPKFECISQYGRSPFFSLCLFPISYYPHPKRTLGTDNGVANFFYLLITSVA